MTEIISSYIVQINAITTTEICPNNLKKSKGLRMKRNSFFNDCFFSFKEEIENLNDSHERVSPI